MVLYATSVNKETGRLSHVPLPDTPLPPPSRTEVVPTQTAAPTPTKKEKPIMSAPATSINPDQVNDVLPRIHVIACGGTGCNLASLCYDATVKQSGDLNIKWSVFDTSKANLARIGERPMEVHLLGDTGNGGVRGANFESHVNQISTIMTDDESDIYILLHSMSGGSGSVIAPLLVQEISTMGGGIVLMSVIDKASRVETTNTRKTLQSIEGVLDNLADNYEPGTYTDVVNLCVFDNQFGRVKVNGEVVGHFATLLKALDIRYVEGMDFANLLNVITPTRNPELVGFNGVKQMSILSDKLEHTTTHTPSSISNCVTKLEINCESKVGSQMRFYGVNQRYEDQISILTGLPMPEILYTDIEATETTQSKLKNQRTVWKNGTRGQAKGGIIL